MHIITIVITNVRSLRIYSKIRLTFEYTEYLNICPTPIWNHSFGSCSYTVKGFRIKIVSYIDVSKLTLGRPMTASQRTLFRGCDLQTVAATSMTMAATSMPWLRTTCPWPRTPCLWPQTPRPPWTLRSAPLCPLPHTAAPCCLCWASCYLNPSHPPSRTVCLFLLLMT